MCLINESLRKNLFDKKELISKLLLLGLLLCWKELKHGVKYSELV